jgi:hypothetical protein
VPIIQSDAGAISEIPEIVPIPLGPLKIQLLHLVTPSPVTNRQNNFGLPQLIELGDYTRAAHGLIGSQKHFVHQGVAENGFAGRSAAGTPET